ncbi:MAG: hypothetical protein ACT4QG_19380 [Sporichthyaceae bacterium]
MRRTARLVAAWALAAGSVVGFASVAHGDSDVLFRFQDERITESSGLAQSLRDSHRVWTNNDSGDSARVYAVDSRTGRTTATLDLPGVAARDWEAMTTCRDSGGDERVWVGDVGDNLDAWKTYKFHEIDEPSEPKDGPADFTSYTVQYADGKARDAEAMLCHPKTGRLYLVSKESEGGVYEGPSTMRSGGTNRFQRIASAPSTVTDATFLPDGKHAVLRGYREAWVVDVEEDWKVVATFFPPLQIQGETIAVAADGKALLFGSEGLNASVYRVDLPADLTQLQNSGDDLSGTQATPTPNTPPPGGPTSSPSPVPLDSAAGQAADSEGIPGISGPWVALLSALAVGAVVLALASRKD